MIGLGPFVLDAPLGKGGMGEVWRGCHRSQRVPVAIKVITSHRADDPRVLEALRNEVRAVARLHHASIILVLDHGVVDDAAAIASEGRLTAGSPYLAMELVSGGTLGDAPPDDWASLRALLVDVLDALGHAHARGLIHRDLKPSNVLRAGPEDVRDGLRLTDFGLARALDRVEGERERVVSGTPRYMAPEQIAGGPRDEGPWTDLYALGVIAWQLVSGALPFGDGDGLALMQRHLTAAVPALTPRFEVPLELEGWIARLLAKRPCNRFSQAADAAWALRSLPAPVTGRRRRRTAEALADAPTGAMPTPTPPRPEVLADDATDMAAELPHDDRPQPWEHDPVRPPAPAPPPPATWRRNAEPAPLRLLGAGLGLYGLRPVPLVGREQERDLLWRALRTVSERRSTRVVAVHGAAGCGKSRIVQWIGQRAQEVGGATVLRAGHGPIAGPADGLAGMVAALLRCSGEPRDATTARCQRFLEEHAPPPPDPDEHLALTELALGERRGAAARLATPGDRYFVLRRLLERVAVRRPVMVWLDDVQWGGDALAFVEFALDADRAHPLPLLFVLTARDEAVAVAEAPRPIEAEQLATVEEHPATTRLEVGPLPLVDHAALVKRLLGLSGPLVDAVVRRTEGNPLFAVQLVGDWVQRGVLVAGPDGFELAPGERAALPDDIHGLWRVRVERTLTGFAPHALPALERAAALGLDVDGDEWRAACDDDAAPPPGLIDALVTYRLAHGTDAAWSFAHAMLRESLERGAADAGRLAGHHRACAAMLARRDPDAAAIAERAGRHLLAAGDLEAALGPLLIAAERRRRRGDLSAADALFEEHERALRELGAPAGDPRWGAGWVRRARVYLGSGRIELARALLDRADAATAAHPWAEVRARALAARARLEFERGDAETAYRDGHRALEAYVGVDDARGRAECLIELGETCMWRWRLDEAMRHFRAAHELAVISGDLDHVGATLRGMGNVRACEGDLDLGAELLERARQTFHDGGSRIQYAICLNALGEIARLRGDLDGALTLYRQSAGLHEAVGSAGASTPRFNLALVLLERGRFAEARRDFEALADELAGGERTLDLLWTHIALVACAAAEADWPAWERHLGAAEARLGGGAVDEDLATLSTRAADLTRDAGDRARAARLYAIAAGLWDRLGQPERAEGCRASA